MLHHVDDAADVVEVGQQRFAVLAVAVDHVHGSACRSEVDLLAPRLEVVLLVLAVKDEMATGLGERVLDERTGEQHPAVLADLAAGTRQDLDARRRGIGEADLLEQTQGGLVDLLNRRIGQRPVVAGGQSWRDRPDVVGQRRRALGAPQVSAAGTTCRMGSLCHGCTSYALLVGTWESGAATLDCDRSAKPVQSAGLGTLRQ